MTSKPVEESRLLLSISEGDENAFRELFYQYVPEISSLITRVAGSYAVEDIVQEVFLRVWMSRDKLQEIKVLHHWIKRIAYHQAFNWLRKEGYKEKALMALEAGHDQHHENSTEEVFLYRKMIEVYRRAVNELPFQSKRIYLMSREHGIKLQDIAHELGLSLRTVKNSISRSLGILREYMEKHGYVLPGFVYWMVFLDYF